MAEVENCEFLKGHSGRRNLTNADVRAEKVGECKDGGEGWVVRSGCCGARRGKYEEPKNLSVSFTRELLHTRGMKLHWTESKYIVDDDDFEDIK